MTTIAEQFWEPGTNPLMARGKGGHDPTNPEHYKTNGLEAIEVIEAFFMHSPHLANVFKYIARAGKKDNEVQDLKKAAWYLDRWIEIKENKN